MSSKVQLTGGAFQDAAGNVLANGYLLMTLSQDGQVNSADQIASGVELTIPLDANGNIETSPAQYVWPNDAITPANTFYLVSAYTAEGQLVWGPNAQQVLSTPSPFNVGVWIPGGINLYSLPITVYDVGCYIPYGIAASETILLLPFERAVTFAANLIPSVASAGATSTGSYVLSVCRNGTQFATITFNPGVATAVIDSISGASFVPGDILTIVAPSSTDATLQNVGILLSGIVSQ